MTYVNANHGNSRLSVEENSLKGVLGGRLNAENVRRIVVRLSDDSPEDNTGGALLFRERIFIDDVEHPEIKLRLTEERGARACSKPTAATC